MTELVCALIKLGGFECSQKVQSPKKAGARADENFDDSSYFFALNSVINKVYRDRERRGRDAISLIRNRTSGVR